MVPLNIRRIVRNCVRDAKVDQLELAFDKNEVGGLEVRVDDLLFVNHVHRFEHLMWAFSVHIDNWRKNNGVPASSNKTPIPGLAACSASPLSSAPNLPLRTP